MSRDDFPLQPNRERLDRASENADFAARQFVRAMELRQAAEAEYERRLEQHRAELADAEAA